MDSRDLIISVEEARDVLGESAVSVDDETILGWIINLDTIALAALEEAQRRRWP